MAMNRNYHVLLNKLHSLNHRLLVVGQECDKCYEKSKKWCLLDTCQHTLCRKCFDVKRNDSFCCPACNVKFDRHHINTVEEMKDSFCAMENFVIKLMETLSYM